MMPLQDKTDSMDNQYSDSSIEVLMEVENKENYEGASPSTSSSSNSVENAKKKLKRSVQRKRKNKNKKTYEIVKRPMLRFAEPKKIFGPDADKLFTRSEEEIEKFISKMDHATRFYLAVKFYRRSSLDFEENNEFQCNFSKERICKILGVVSSTIKSFCRKTLKKQALKNFMESKNFLSPVEFNPRQSEPFFKKYASNYTELKIGGVFANRD